MKPRSKIDAGTAINPGTGWNLLFDLFGLVGFPLLRHQSRNQPFPPKWRGRKSNNAPKKWTNPTLNHDFQRAFWYCGGFTSQPKSDQLIASALEMTEWHFEAQGLWAYKCWGLVTRGRSKSSSAWERYVSGRSPGLWKVTRKKRKHHVNAKLQDLPKRVWNNDFLAHAAVKLAFSSNFNVIEFQISMCTPIWYDYDLQKVYEPLGKLTVQAGTEICNTS